MSTWRIAGDGWSVVLTDSITERFNQIALAAIRATTAEVEAALEPIAQTARAQWYGPNGVKRVTGASGDIQVVTTIAADMSTVTVAVGSTDTRLVKGADGRSRPRATTIHRPGALAAATKRVEISKDEYFRRWRINKEAGRKVYLIAEGTEGFAKGAAKTGKYYGLEAVPGAKTGDGAYLLPLLVVSPARRALRGLNVKIGRRVAAILKGAS